MTPDEILLEGAPNFRDFGGYATDDGRRVRRRRLYRSELLLDLTERDLATLAGLDIGLVCDLRSPGERNRLSNEWPADRPYELLALDLGGSLSAVQPDKWSRKLADPSFDATRAQDALANNYRRMPASYAGDLRALFDRLTRADAKAVLVHCAAGKDRTGFVSAMLLTALGVPRDTIMQDYLATQARYSFERLINTRLRLVLHVEQLPEHANNALRVLASVRREFLEAAYETLTKDYGGAERYLENLCELTPARRDALHAALLES